MKIILFTLKPTEGGDQLRRISQSGLGLSSKMKFIQTFFLLIANCSKPNLLDDLPKFLERCLPFQEDEILSNVEVIIKNWYQDAMERFRISQINCKQRQRMFDNEWRRKEVFWRRRGRKLWWQKQEIEAKYWRGSSKLVMENKLTLIQVSILAVLPCGENWPNFNYLLLNCLSSVVHYHTTLSQLFKSKYTSNYIIYLSSAYLSIILTFKYQNGYIAKIK